MPEDAKGLKFRVQASDVLVVQLNNLVQTRRSSPLKKSMVDYKPKLSMVEKTHAQIPTITNSSRYRMSSPKLIMVF